MSKEKLYKSYEKNIHFFEANESNQKNKARDKFQKLKGLGFYDYEFDQWKSTLKNSSNRYSKTQLLGILVENIFDKENAKNAYKKLKKTDLYDKNKNQWNWYITDDQTYIHTNRIANAQLLGVLVDSIFDIKKAEEQLNRLKNTKIFNKKYNQWNWFLKEDQSDSANLRYADIQLLGVLVEGIFDKKKAKDNYKSLKKNKTI